MTKLRNLLAHWQAVYFIWRSSLRTTQTSAWALDPNRYEEFDSPAYERPAYKG